MLDVAEEDGIEPKALQDRPELPESLLFVWNAWWALCADRAMGFGGAGPIPFSAVDRYATRFGVHDQDDFETFAALIAAMDDVFFAAQSKRLKAKPQGTD